MSKETPVCLSRTESEEIKIFITQKDSNNVNKLNVPRIKVIIINMERSKDRKENAQINVVDKLPNIKCEFFKAVDGKNEVTVVPTSFDLLDLILYNERVFIANYLERVDYTERGKMNLPQIGGCLSHIAVCQDLIFDANCDYFLVLEDDSNLNCDESELTEYLKNLPSNFDFIHLLGSDADEFVKSTQVNEYFWNVERKCFNRAGAYLISKIGASKLVAFLKNNICRPVDDAFSHLNWTSSYNVLVPSKWLFKCSELPTTMEY